MNNFERLKVITGCRCGCVIAPAGCGKTEQIALAVMHGDGRRLILTHTLAGVDALSTRLKNKGVDPACYQVTTIAAWSLRVTGAFPLRSGISLIMPTNNKEWDAVYGATVTLLKSKCIDGIIRASYSGVFVDEYQDCNQLQHQLVYELARLLPCCIFGDPLQAIFAFGGNTPPDWDSEVLEAFPVVAEFSHPWRWNNAGNSMLGKWLLDLRGDLLNNRQIDLSKGPSTVIHATLAGDSNEIKYREKVRLVKRALDARNGERCIVIGDSKNEAGRASLAQKVRASAVESIMCSRLAKFVDALGASQGLSRLNLILELVKGVMTGAEVASLLRVVNAVSSGKRRKKLDAIEEACVEITHVKDLKPLLILLEAIRSKPNVWVYRRELYSSLCAALRMVIYGTHASLPDAVWDVQNRRRHAGRRFSKRSIGSTLLVKGLEFDHAIIVDIESLKRNDLYVAMTRASRSVTIISETCLINHVSH